MGLVLAAAVGAWGQQGSGGGSIGPAVEKEVKGLAAEDYAERQAALKRLEALRGAQI